MQTKITRILFPTDFSADAAYALSIAHTLAEDTGAELVLLHVVEDIVAPAYFGAHYDPAILSSADLETSAMKELDQVLPAAGTGTVSVRRLIRRGSAYAEILAVAQDEACDLIIMATHGHSGLAHLLLGSTAERIVRAAPVPVLTIRHPERAKAESEPSTHAATASNN